MIIKAHSLWSDHTNKFHTLSHRGRRKTGHQSFRHVKCIYLNENYQIFIHTPLKFVLNESPLVQVNGSTPVRCQGIAWNNDDPLHWPQQASMCIHVFKCNTIMTTIVCCSSVERCNPAYARIPVGRKVNYWQVTLAAWRNITSRDVSNICGSAHRPVLVRTWKHRDCYKS